jgi:hypothetical protein
MPDPMRLVCAASPASHENREARVARVGKVPGNNSP